MKGQEKHCRNCGKVFRSSIEHKTLCSDECKEEWRRKYEEARLAPMKPCAFCGKMFKPDNKHLKLCSDFCKYERYKDQKIGTYWRHHKDWLDKQKSLEWDKTKEYKADQYDRIEELAAEHGVSIQVLFKRCGLSGNIYSSFERGLSSLGLESLCKISARTDKSINWLIGLE